MPVGNILLNGGDDDDDSSGLKELNINVFYQL
jgi:hypothetical protein